MDTLRECPICGAALPGGIRRTNELICPACGVDIGPLIDMNTTAAPSPSVPGLAAAPSYRAAAKPPERNAWLELLRTAAIGAGVGAVTCAIVAAPIGHMFNTQMHRAALAGAQFGGLLGLLFGLLWTAIERFERPIVAAPLIAIPGALVAGSLNHFMITAGGLMPDLTIYESLEVSFVTGLAGGLIAGALKNRE
jgi:hypothetical protein